MSQSNYRLSARGELSQFIDRVFPFIYDLLHIRRWRKYMHSMPAPWRVKMGVLDRYKYSDTPWIETGTFFGKTTRYLARTSPLVISLEPSPMHFSYAESRLKSLENVHLLNVASENGLAHALGLVPSDCLCLWLDGHYSDGGTFLGIEETPIRTELSIVKEWLNSKSGRKVAMFIDDVRCFGSQSNQGGSYPSLSELVRWADSLAMTWTIEHDIFVAKSDTLVQPFPRDVPQEPLTLV